MGGVEEVSVDLYLECGGRVREGGDRVGYGLGLMVSGGGGFRGE